MDIMVLAVLPPQYSVFQHIKRYSINLNGGVKAGKRIRLPVGGVVRIVPIGDLD